MDAAPVRPVGVLPSCGVYPYGDDMRPDDPLTDDALQEEIELVGALVLEASASDGPMDQEHIDAVLGVGEGDAPAESDADGDDATAEDAGS